MSREPARRLSVLLLVALPLPGASAPADEAGQAQGVVDIGSRLELFADDFLIDSLGGASLMLHHPVRAGVALRFDEPWEGAFVGYVTVIKDTPRGGGAPLYRMYYRGLPAAGADGSAVESTCYAESGDGVRWRKPRLGLFEVAGSKENNVVLKGFSPASHNFCPFIDRNPAAPPAERFKALGGTSPGLFAFASPDGIHWRRLREQPVLTKGAFDSQNVSFWSEAEGRYLCYFRTWDGYRSISRASSPDFIHWSDPRPMTYGDTPREHLYTNQTHPYFRAPHISISVAARFMAGRRVLTPEQARSIHVDPKYFGDCSDAVLMTTRGGTRYRRTFMEAFVRPGIGLENWVSRTNYPALGIVETGDGELSIYVQKNYGQPTAHLVRYTLRTDGFASLHGPYSGGEAVTRPVRFTRLSSEELAARRRAASGSASGPARIIEGDRVPHGSGALDVELPVALPLPETRSLGRGVTLAVHLRDVPAGHRRIFSGYNGGSTSPRELVLDVDAGGPIDEHGSIRFFYDDAVIGARPEATGRWNIESGDHRVHHVAATWDDGVMTLFFDGKIVARGGEKGAGAIELALGDLRFGEDYPPTQLENEPFLGIADDILVLRRALAPDEIARIAAEGAASVVAAPAGSDGGVLFTFEGEGDERLENRIGPGRLELEGAPDRSLQELILNVSTSAAGSVRVEIQDAGGEPIEGFRLEDSVELIGDAIERPARWTGGRDLSELGGRPIRLRFVLHDADVYSLRFR